MTDMWFYMCIFQYAILMYVVYKAYLSKLVQKLKGRNMYLHYHIVDTGEHGDRVFYEEGNAEPLKVARDVSKYTYYCDTKNFDTVCRNDILQTLMVLRAKDIIVILIIIAMALTMITCVANLYFLHDAQSEIIKAVVSATTPVVLP